MEKVPEEPRARTTKRINDCVAGAEVTPWRTMRFAFLVMLTAVLFCSGCFTPMRVEGPSTLSEQHKFVKSYSLGEQKTVTVGDSIMIRQAGAGLVTLVAGATINRRLTLKAAGQHATMCLTCVAADTYDLTGDVATS